VGAAVGPGSTVVAEGDAGLFLQKTDGSQSSLPLEQKDRYEVYRTRDIALAKGDRIRITKNGEAKVEGQKKGSGTIFSSRRLLYVGNRRGDFD